MRLLNGHDTGKSSGGKALGLLNLRALGLPTPKTWVVPLEDRLVKSALLRNLPEGNYAVRSSAPLEDTEAGSFAGQFITELNVPRANVPAAIRSVRQTPKAAVEYAAAMNLTLQPTIPVLVQPMVDAKLSGVVFSHDITKGSLLRMRIELVEGPCAALVSGQATPDYVFTPMRTTILRERETNEFDTLPINLAESTWLRLGIRALIRNKASFDVELMFAAEKLAENMPPRLDRTRYGNWLFLQFRPLSIAGLAHAASLGIGTGVVRGTVRWRFSSPEENAARSPLTADDILVAQFTTPDLISDMLVAKAVITVIGGATSHAAIVARELGKPALVGHPDAATLHDGDEIEIDLDANLIRRHVS